MGHKMSNCPKQPMEDHLQQGRLNWPGVPKGHKREDESIMSRLEKKKARIPMP